MNRDKLIKKLNLDYADYEPVDPKTCSHYNTGSYFGGGGRDTGRQCYDCDKIWLDKD